MVTMAMAAFHAGDFAFGVAVPMLVQHAGHHASERIAHQQ
jgi:hypothetical protein